MFIIKWCSEFVDLLTAGETSFASSRRRLAFRRGLPGNQAAALEHQSGKGPDFVVQRSLRQQICEPAGGWFGRQGFGRAQAGESATMVAQNGHQFLLVDAAEGFPAKADVFFTQR